MYKNKESMYNGIPREELIKIYGFAIKTREKTKLGQNTITQLIKSKFNKDLSSGTISGWIHHDKIPFNQEKTQFKPKPKPPKKELYKFYIKQKISAQRLAKKYKVSTIIVINWLKSYNIKVRNHKQSMNTKLIKKELRNLKLIRPTKNYKPLSPEKAYVLGVICGDGHINKNYIRFEIRYDVEFIKEFSECINKVYGIKPNYHFYKPKNSYVLYVASQIIARDLLRYCIFGTYYWNAPKIILNSNDKKIISSYLRGLYDSEGSINTYYINFCSISKQGINDVSYLLSKIDIENKLWKDKRGYHHITISRKRNLRLFKELIGFTIKRKMKRLENPYRLGW